ncbi:SDR family oxidoreductase [Citricoccus parietis]|uniref:SDR family oxidoreductase n=1 Tax=Citricoccus parietis TaxID=592307 RepID=A0ABV5G811_9MICC
MAHAAAFLLSDEARWITGQILAVDGGPFGRSGPATPPVATVAR